jgi:hypothetical protein
MKISKSTLILFSTAISKAKSDTACIADGAEFVLNGCDFESFESGLQDYLNRIGCAHDAKTELRRIYNTNMGSAKKEISSMCATAWDQVSSSSFSEIDSRFNSNFMNQYVAGDTFLNTETGSFQGTTEGNNIDNFRDNGAVTTVMDDIRSLAKCDYNSIMCCFGRDRQPNDNNGNCADPIDTNCLDADPADNSNLCYVEHDLKTYSDPFAFPDDSEGDIHCHGLAWADDINAFSAKLRFNNFFYVSLYDHMYTRGYVETSVDSDSIPMCGCIEEMPPVSRADCTEIEAKATFTITYDAVDLFKATTDDDLTVEFNACQGTNPSNGNDANNDLASYVYRLNQEGKVDDNVKNKVFETLVGYNQPGNNNNEEACVAAYEANFGTYPDVADKKCPFDSSRLFRTEDNNPWSLEECQYLCYSTDGCDYFSVGLDAAPELKGLCIGCSASTLETHDGFNTYEMTDKQVFPSQAPSVASDKFEVVGSNLKCPMSSAHRLFRTNDDNPMTRQECYQKCYDTPGCTYFTYGVNPSSDMWKGLCMGCTGDSTLVPHDGFTSYELTEFKEVSQDYELIESNKKCPSGKGRLFRSGDSSLTRDECYQMCVDTQDCEFFTYGEGGNLPSQFQGLCMGCTGDAVLSRHNGFNTYSIL